MDDLACKPHKEHRGSKEVAFPRETLADNNFEAIFHKCILSLSLRCDFHIFPNVGELCLVILAILASLYADLTISSLVVILNYTH